MSSFSDGEGRVWEIKITLGLRDRIKARCKFDFVDERNKGFTQLVESLFELDRVVDLLGVICEPQLKERGMTTQQMFDAIDGDSLDAAQLALVEGFEDFFRQTRRVHLAETLRETWKGWETLLGTVATKVTFAAKDAMNKTLSELSGSLPAS